MKIVVISDCHGRTKWKQQVQEPADLYIFLGDYFDSFDIKGDDQIENFRDIQQFYQDNPGKVVLLTGNHDLSYLDPDCACSGYQNKYAYEIGQLLKPLRENGDISICKVINQHIFVHAGIAKDWVKKYNINSENLEKEVNELFQKNIQAFCFQEHHMLSGYADPYGDDTFQSPCWIRPYSLGIDKLDNYQQIIGHTGVEKVKYSDGIWFTDCQDSSDDFLILEI